MKKIKFKNSVFGRLIDCRFEKLNPGTYTVRDNGAHDPGVGHVHTVETINGDQAVVRINNINTGLEDFDRYCIIPDCSPV